MVNMAMASVLVPLVVRESFGNKDCSAIFALISVSAPLFGPISIALLIIGLRPATKLYGTK